MCRLWLCSQLVLMLLLMYPLTILTCSLFPLYHHYPPLPLSALICLLLIIMMHLKRRCLIVLGPKVPLRVTVPPLILFTITKRTCLEKLYGPLSLIILLIFLSIQYNHESTNRYCCIFTSVLLYSSLWDVCPSV